MDEILVVGEALVDIVQRLDGTRTEHPGGSPTNVALGLGRLGRRPHLLTRIGRDERGERVRAHLQASGVVLVEGSMTDSPTSTATATIDAAGVASYLFEVDWHLPALPDLSQFHALHTGSIGTFLPPGGDEVAGLVAAATEGMTVTYDPNARPQLMGDAGSARARVERFVGLSDVVKVSDEDLQWLAPGEDPVDVAQAWLGNGPAVVIVTMGGQGAVGLCHAGRVDVPAPQVTVVDTVGAGDSFMSTLLDQLAANRLLGGQALTALHAVDTATVRTMIEQCVKVAAITCSRAGANPPTRAELDAGLQP